MHEPVVLNPGREKPVRQGHPWIFSGAIASIPKKLRDGDIVQVTDTAGRWLAQGYLNRTSQIQVRLVSWDKSELIDDEFWRRRLAAALARRQNLPDAPGTTVLRLVNAESDFLPGLTVDRFGDWLVLQAGTLAIDQRKTLLAEQLMRLTGCRGVLERSDMSVRRQEGLAPMTGLLAGEAPSGPVAVQEHGLHFLADLEHGQKTGFYADQRANRRKTAAYCSGKRVLNGFSYTGAFAVHALAAGASHVTNLDSSVEALELAEQNLRLNGFDPDSQAEGVAGDVFAVLRDWRDARDEGLLFDVVILDPPKFVQSQQHLDRALRGYKDVNLLGMQLVKPGGYLVTFSCSGLVSADLFQKVVFGAAADVGRPMQIVERLSHGGDHPVAITFPEGEYLKGLILRVE